MKIYKIVHTNTFKETDNVICLYSKKSDAISHLKDIVENNKEDGYSVVKSSYNDGYLVSDEPLDIQNRPRYYDGYYIEELEVKDKYIGDKPC